MKPSPFQTASKELPAVIREDFERWQRKLLPDPKPNPTDPRERFIQHFVYSDHPMTTDHAGQWFDHYYAEVYLRVVAEKTRLWWDQAEAALAVRSQENLEALAAHLEAVAPGAFLRATLPELQPFVGRPSVASYLVDCITEAVNAKRAIALLREGSHVDALSAATAVESDRCQPPEQDSVAQFSKLQALAALRKSRWGNSQARTALQLVCGQGYSVRGISRTTAIPRSTLQRFKQGKSKKLGAEELLKLIETLYPIVRQLAKRPNN